MKDDSRFGQFRKVIAAVAAGALIIAAIYLGVQQRRPGRGTITLGENVAVKVEVADTPQTREKGLSGRESLAAGEGMLFIFPAPDTYIFWMKDMKFPIDIIWIRDREIVDIITDVPVPVPNQELSTYFPKFPADKVLEAGAGFAAAHGLRVGMPVETHIDK